MAYTAVQREIDAATIAELSKPFFHANIMTYLDWPDAPFRVHSGRGAMSWDGETWDGLGGVGRHEFPSMSTGLSSVEGSFALVAAPDEINEYIEDDVNGQDAIFYLACTTERAGNVLAGEPFFGFVGVMDGIRDLVDTDTETMQITRIPTVGLKSKPSQRLSYGAYHTYSDQIAKYPGDTAGRHAQNATYRSARRTWPT